MDYGTKTLPLTGGGIAIGGIMFDQLWLIGVAFALVAIGAIAIKVGFRRGKDASQP